MTDVNEQDSNTDDEQDSTDREAPKEQDSKEKSFEDLPQETQKLIKQLRRQNADFRKEAEATKAEQKKREEAEATEKGEWEKLAKDRETKIADLEAQLKARDAATTKAAIAKKHGIPDDLIPMLQGETEDDIDASAKTVAKHLKVRESTDIDAGVKTQNGERKKAETDKKAFADPARWGLRQR